ncbi:hypothetical protein BpHYR1_021752 [Brachionus plicatilis]|uniref:Uncharacterized protein n=1 Tax=Brachionus plicatilis TaxID=10195 RepID=A0A3M7T211_BRAPC|nr:hypothetical protein BpHYR1_021752 [Brachionus plicatilis]
MVIKPGNSIKWNFRNSIKLNLKSLDRPLTHHDLLTYLSRSLSEEEKSKVISVGNFSSNRFWIIEFHPSLNTVNLFDRPVLIEKRQFKFEDPNKFKIDDGKKSATLSSHFLPTNITDQTIARFINNLKLKDLEIKEISNEKFKEDGWTEVNNGIKRVRILYPIEINEQIQNLVGPTTLAVDDDLPTLSYPEDGDNGEEMEQTEQHPLDSYIESFDPTVKLLFKIRLYRVLLNKQNYHFRSQPYRRLSKIPLPNPPLIQNLNPKRFQPRSLIPDQFNWKHRYRAHMNRTMNPTMNQITKLKQILKKRG